MAAACASTSAALDNTGPFDGRKIADACAEWHAAQRAAMMLVTSAVVIAGAEPMIEDCDARHGGGAFCCPGAVAVAVATSAAAEAGATRAAEPGVAA